MKRDSLRPQLRLSAVAALRPALHCVLVTLVMIPVTSLIGLMFGENREVDWKLSIAVGSVLGFAWFVAIFVSTLADLQKEHRIHFAKTPSFPAQSFISGVYGVATVGSAWLVVALHRERESLWLQLAPLGFAALAFYGWPRTISCAETQVCQRNLFGWKKRIPYVAVEAISVSADGTTTVLGAGTTIEHTPYHIDPLRFREVVSRHSGKPVY